LRRKREKSLRWFVGMVLWERAVVEKKREGERRASPM
jgi:hypothetical protein